jgi:hypothetical protein
LADAFERDEIDGLTDAVTIGQQLAGLRYEADPRGRIKIESKEKARERGVRSSASAEALGRPPEKYEYHSIRDRVRFSPEIAGDPCQDEDDYPRFIGRWDLFAPRLGWPRGGGAW